jgi:predicted permease
VAQVALVLLMASGAVLLVRSVRNLRAIDAGVNPAGVAVIDLIVPSVAGGRGIPATVRDAQAVVASLPGVETAAVTQRLPLRGSSDNWGIGVEDQPDLPPTTTAFRVVTPDYFQTMGIRVSSGRGLLETDRDASAGEGAVVINQALADKYFPGIDPIGRRIAFMNTRWDRIVGVVENVAEGALTDAPIPARYMVHDQVPFLLDWQTLVLRVADGREPAAILDAARRAIQTGDPAVAIREMTTMENVFTRSIGPAVQVMSLLAILGALALALGVVGVYGVVSHSVTRRRRDYGIRLALGMRPSVLIGQIVGRGGMLVGCGIAIGVVAFVATTRVLASFLYGVSTVDAVSLGVAAALLLLAGVAAASLPALRAARIDPAKVLREQ